MRRDLRERQQRLGLTTILVTHDQEEANTMCDRIAVMDGGVVQQIGLPSELYEKPNILFIANFLGAANILSGTVSGTGEHRVFSTGNINMPVRTSRDVATASSLRFRPQDISIVTAADQADGLRLDGDVIFREFLGSNVRYSIRANATTILVDVPFHSGDKLFNTGERLSLVVPPSALHWVTN